MAISPGHFTFLFTDIEGSTHLWEQYPEEMARQLARHDSILQHAIESHDGRVFARGGDGFCAAFASSLDALLAAVDVQREVAGLGVGGDLVRVRIGVHRGPAEERGGDYFGDTLNRAARLTASAHGGQIVLTSGVVDTIGPLPTPLGLRELGSHRFRGLERPERVSQVVHPDLDQEFPPLRSSTRPTGNLPTARVTLVGRQDDVESLIQLIEGRPLVTLTGPGGVGKSSLAIEVARRLNHRFADGTWWVDLTTISSGDRVAYAVSSTLRIRTGTGNSAIALRTALEDRQLLVILDNCEHVRDGAASIAHDLTLIDGVRVLATSRSPLGVGGEVTWPVKPLAVPASPAHRNASLETAAVRLFVERATDVDPALDLTGDLPTVATVVGRLAGLPLAIELAASRLRTFAPSELLHQLEDLDILATTAPFHDRRHATMEQTIRWSWELLGNQARILLTRLSILRGTFSLLTVQAVAGGSPFSSRDVAPALAELVESSMVVHEVRDGASRYSLLEPIRQFAASKLDPRDDTQLRHRHLDHFLEMAARLSPGIGRFPPPAAMGILGTERQNLMQAVEWGLMHGRPEDAIRLFGHGLWFVLYVAADTFEVVRTWMERVLAPPRLDDMWVTQMVECAAPIASIAARNHDWLRWLDEGRAAAEETETAWSFVAWSGYALMREGHRQEAADRFAEVLAGSQSAELRALALVGNGLLADPGAGWGFIEEALDLLADGEWRWVGRAELWMFVSWVALEAGRYNDVSRYSQMCLDAARRFGLSVIEVHALATAARAALAAEDLTAANHLALEAVSVAARIFGSNYAVSDAHLAAADVCQGLGLLADALDHVRQARTAAQRYGIPRHEALADIEEAKITAQLGSLGEARLLIDRARRVVAHPDDPLLLRLEAAERSLGAGATTRSTHQ